MIAKTVHKIGESDEGHPALSASQHPITAHELLHQEFVECWAALEGDNDNFDEHALRRKIEGLSDNHLETSVCDYLRDLVLHNPFHFFTKGLRVKLLGDVTKRWRWYDKSTVEDATKLRECILSVLKCYMDHAPPKMKLRVRIDLWKKPQPIPAHNTAPAFGVAIDAITGEIHRRFYGTNMPLSETPLIACGLTILIQPFRHGDEAWTQDQGQGGYMFSEDQTMLTNDRAMRLEGPKP
jgi:hypothetical protein